MNHKFFLIIPFVLILLSGFMIYRSMDHLRAEKETKRILQDLDLLLPEMFTGTFADSSGSNLIATLKAGETNTAIGHGRPVLVIYFNSECDVCREEIQELRDSGDKLGSMQVLLVSHEPRSQGLMYLEEVGILTSSQIIYPETDAAKVISLFGPGVPQVLVYHDRKLKKHFYGFTSIHQLISRRSWNR